MIAQPKPKRERNEARLEFCRQLCCLILSRCSDIAKVSEHMKVCDWLKLRRSEAHHIREGGLSGVGTKPSDFRTVPLCMAGHEEYHRIGRSGFYAKYNIAFEAEIVAINKEFERLNAPPKRERKKPMKAVLHVLHCEACTHPHEVPTAKLLINTRGVIRFRCINKNQVVEL